MTVPFGSEDVRWFGAESFNLLSIFFLFKLWQFYASREERNSRALKIPEIPTIRQISRAETFLNHAKNCHRLNIDWRKIKRNWFSSSSSSYDDLLKKDFSWKWNDLWKNDLLCVLSPFYLPREVKLFVSSSFVVETKNGWGEKTLFKSKNYFMVIYLRRMRLKMGLNQSEIIPAFRELIYDSRLD